MSTSSVSCPPGDFTVSFALDGVFYPIMGDYVEIDYHPIFSLSGGTNYKTNSVEIFLQPEVLNVFNESAVIDRNEVINTRRYGCSSSVCQYFDPFDASYTPVEGLDYEFGDNFGEPDNDGDFQDPRIVRFSVGIRF